MMDENEANEQLNGLNDDEIANFKSKGEKLSQLRRKEQGQKYEVKKIDYAGQLKKTQKPEAGFHDKKKHTDGPNYLGNLRKTETGVSTQPEYIRLAKRAESEGKHVERKYTADELIDMAFRKADDADTRDPAVRRGITQKPVSTPGTFQGIQVKSDEKEDYKSKLKQHVAIEPKTRPKVEDNKPSWANVAPKRVVEADIINRSKENKQEKPEWAQFGRGATKHIVELEHAKPAEKSQTPEWASFASKTDRKKLIQLEQKKTAANNEPEWAAKSRDAREILRVEHKAPKKSSGSDDAPDYKGVLRRSSRKESITFGELQRALGEEQNEVIGWKLIDRLTLVSDVDQSKYRSGSPIHEEFLDENENDVNRRPINNDVDQDDVFESKERKLRRVSSSANQRERKRSSTVHFSLARAIPTDVRRKVSSVLMNWAKEILSSYENCTVDNFTSSWENGLGFCYIMHYFEEEKVPLNRINPSSKRGNLIIAFQVASDVGISMPVTVDDFMKSKIPDAYKVFDVLYEIYAHYCGSLIEYAVIK